MSRKLKVLAVLNVVGWLVAVPLLLFALLGPMIGFTDWPGAPGDGPSRPSDVRLGDAGGPGGPGGRPDGEPAAGPLSATPREALDRALARRSEQPPGAGGTDPPGVPASLPLPGGDPAGPGEVRGEPGEVVDLGGAPPLSPDGPTGPDRPRPDGGDGDGDGADDDGPVGPVDPDVPAPAPGGAEPAGGTDTPAGPGGRTKSGTRPDGESYAEVQVAGSVEEVDAGQGAVPTAAAEPPAPAPADSGAGVVEPVATPTATATPSAPVPAPQPPDGPAPPEAPVAGEESPEAVRPPEDGGLDVPEEQEPPGGGG